jgi:DNA-binding GntR family transcriptional regulator
MNATFGQIATIERPATVKAKVCQILETAILQGLIGEREVLSEAGLAQKLNVSRTPVREALQELVGRGLLEPVGARGRRIRRIRPEEVRDLFWLRGVLEGAIAERLALHTLTSAQVAELQRHLEDQRAAIWAKDWQAFLSADSSFHVALANCISFPIVTVMVANLRQLFQLVGMKAARHASNPDEILAEHTAILKAIQRGDAPGARRATEEHLQPTERFVLSVLKGKAKASSPGRSS